MRCSDISMLNPPQAKLSHTYYKYQESYQGYSKNINRSGIGDGMFRKVAICIF